MNPLHVVRRCLCAITSVPFLGETRGVCLTELMVGLATGAIVLAAAFETFNIVQTRAVREHHAVAHQQDLRLGLEVFEQEVRLATGDSIVTMTPEELEFVANVNGQRTTTTGSVLPGQSVLAVEDGSGWGEGKTVLLCGLETCEAHQLSRAGQRYQLTLAEPVGLTLPPGASVEVKNRVVYYAKSDGEGPVRLMRMVDGGANALIGGLGKAHFSYRDEYGRPAFLPSQVKRVVIEIESDHASRRVIREVGLRS